MNSKQQKTTKPQSKTNNNKYPELNDLELEVVAGGLISWPQEDIPPDANIALQTNKY
jgi:hypothetical protein